MRKSVSFLLILCGISSSVFATSSSVTFSGTAAAFCSFSGVNNGSMVVDPSNTARIGTTYSGGSPASFSIQYLGTPTLSIEEVQSLSVKPNGTSNSDFLFSTSASSGSSQSFSSNQGYLTTTYSGGSADQLTVQLTVTKANGQSVPLGNYSAVSQVTCQ